MPVIVVLNRKGGSGKSTLATHIAAYAANYRINVVLGDLDKQQSSRLWLNLRHGITKNKLPLINHWARGGEGRLLTPPNNQTLLVIDTPGGLQGLELAKVVMLADAVLIPVSDAFFDKSSAADCITELKLLPRIRNHNCMMGVVAMRIDSRITNSARNIADWSTAQGIHFIGHLRHSNMYISCIEKGLTIFDAPPHMVAFDLKQWKPIINWLTPLFDSMKPTVHHPSPQNSPAFNHSNTPTAQTNVTVSEHKIDKTLLTAQASKHTLKPVSLPDNPSIYNHTDIQRINHSLNQFSNQPFTTAFENKVVSPLSSPVTQTTQLSQPVIEPAQLPMSTATHIPTTINKNIKKGFFANLNLPNFLKKK
jgi:chromosome partitioning protein